MLLGPETDRFCTVALLRLRQSGGSWTATISLGGHPIPLLVRAGREPTPLGQPGSLLGLFPDPALHDTDAVLEPGDTIVLYTDGVTEGRCGADLFGQARLDAAITAAGAPSAASLTDEILDQVLQFQSNDPSDDIVIVAVRVP